MLRKYVLHKSEAQVFAVYVFTSKESGNIHLLISEFSSSS